MYPHYILATLLLILLQIVDNAPLARRVNAKMCDEISTILLEETLGGAFNSHYMSVDKPLEDLSGGKREIGIDEVFFLDNNYNMELYSEAAWNLKNHVALTRKSFGASHKITKRGINYSQKWQCESKIMWTDLGPDYFPRYLRSVLCLSDNCWFGTLYKCKPRAFPVKVLKRRSNACVNIDHGVGRVGTKGLPNELKQMWVWEERLVNFCCDCSR